MTVAKRSPPRRRPIRPPASKVPPVRLGVESLRYIESSALLAALLEHDPSALAALRARGRHVTSALTFAEAARGIIRARVAGRLTAALEQAAVRGLRTFECRYFIVDVNTLSSLASRGHFQWNPFGRSTRCTWPPQSCSMNHQRLVTIVTRDARVRDNARALGYSVE